MKAWHASAIEKPWLALGEPFSPSFYEWLRKQSSGFVGPPFLGMKLYFWFLRAESCGYRKLVNEWDHEYA